MDLRGKTILITRAPSQSQVLRTALEQRGAHVLECPTIEIVPIEDWSEIDRAIHRLDSYDWILLTSTNAVEHFMARVRTLDVPCRPDFAAVGPATAEAIARWGVTAVLIPESFRGEGLLDTFPSNMAGKRVLFPRAESARELLPEELRRRGAVVDIVTVYRTLRLKTAAADLQRMLSENHVDCVVFASPSAIPVLEPPSDNRLRQLLARTRIAVIGPIAREAAESAGLQVSIQPASSTVPDLADAIARGIVKQ
jgi:uroporphyrinogen-III synthase